jgi:hypothetical protein
MIFWMKNSQNFKQPSHKEKNLQGRVNPSLVKVTQTQTIAAGKDQERLAKRATNSKVRMRSQMNVVVLQISLTLKVRPKNFH